MVNIITWQVIWQRQAEREAFEECRSDQSLFSAGYVHAKKMARKGDSVAIAFGVSCNAHKCLDITNLNKANHTYTGRNKTTPGLGPRL